MQETGYRRSKKVTITCIFSNLALSLLKLAAGIFGHSQAMISDALHSASDIVSSVVVLIGIKIAGKPVDKDHPYGHGKVEPIAAAIVGLSLVAAVVMILKNILSAIITHSFETPTFLALGAAAVSIIIKESMYRATVRAGRQINSDAMIADAWHHRSDAFSSVGTFVGISGSMIGRWAGIPYLEYLDPAAGAVVACLIIKVAFDILKHAVKRLMDSSPGDEIIKKIRDAALCVGGIISVPCIKGRYVGPYLHIDMEIEVDSEITVEAGHSIAEQTQKEVSMSVDNVYDVLVHVEPSRQGKEL